MKPNFKYSSEYSQNFFLLALFIFCKGFVAETSQCEKNLWNAFEDLSWHINEVPILHNKHMQEEKKDTDLLLQHTKTDAPFKRDDAMYTHSQHQEATVKCSISVTLYDFLMCLGHVLSFVPSSVRLHIYNSIII